MKYNIVTLDSSFYYFVDLIFN